MMCSFNVSLATSREFVPGGQRHQVISAALPRTCKGPDLH